MNSAASLIEALGWTLLHFLWQGTAIALLLWPGLRLLRRAAPSWRYAAAAVALLSMLAAAGATLARHWPEEKVTPTPPVTSAVQAMPGNAQPRPSTPSASEPPDSLMPVVEPRAPEPLPQPTLVHASDFSWQIVVDTLRPHLRWIVGAWALGVALVLVRLGHGWWFLSRLRTTATALPHGQWTARFAEIARALRVSRPVRLLSSATARVPMVIGWMKPVVLVPAALFAGLPAAQLEAILAHELAHVRRHDYLVNLLQCVVEALFFYHPAVWWVSAQLRKEREHCCDDIASRLCGGALPYARALTALEELRGAESVLGLAASGRPLLQRIRRLVGVRETTAFGWPAAVTAIAAAILLPLGIMLAAEKPASESETALPRTTEGAAAIATSKHGTWTFPGGLTLRLYGEVFHATDVMTTALVTWDARDGRPAQQWHTSIASDAFANREKWAVAWEKDKPVLWVASRDIGSSAETADGRPVANRFKRIDLTDPSHIREQYFQNGWPQDDPPPADVAAEMLALMEVPALGTLSSTLHSWAAPGSSERVPLERVENIHIEAAGAQLKVQLAPDERRCAPGDLASTLESMSAAWRSRRAQTLGELAPIPRVTVSLPDSRVFGKTTNITDKSAENNQTAEGKHGFDWLIGEFNVGGALAYHPFATVVQACRDAGVGPMGLPPDVPTPRVRKFDTPTHHGILIEPPNAAAIMIVSEKNFTLDHSSTGLGGTLVFPVNTSDMTLRVGFDWSPAQPHLLHLRNGDREDQFNDLRRGRIIRVDFPGLEFNAGISQVPGSTIRAVDAPSLAKAAADAEAWWKAADAKAKWEYGRVLVPDDRYYAGKALDADAKRILWGAPNEAGLRYGLGGLASGDTVPAGHPLALEHYIRNDGTETVRLSATGPFNEGLEGALVGANGAQMPHVAQVPHVANYKWPMVAIRALLQPGQYIRLQTCPLETVYANPDGSASGAILGYRSGFTVRPGDYELQLTHHIGRFLGKPANTFEGNPEVAPGLGEWTGALTAPPLKLRIAEPTIGSAKAGDVAELRKLDRIQFESERLLLSRPAPGMTGSHSYVVGSEGNWPSFAGEWKLPQPDLGYSAAWDEGNRRLWLVNGPTVHKLDFSGDTWRQSGTWPVTTPGDGYGDMPQGVMTALQLPKTNVPASMTPMIRGVSLEGVPVREDIAPIPELYEPVPGKPGEVRPKPSTFFMSLSPGEAGPWLSHAAGTRHFYLSVRPNPEVVKDLVYGPIEGHPVDRLNLAGWLKESPTHKDPGYARRAARNMLATGDGPLAALAAEWLGGFAPPPAPQDHDWLIAALEKHLAAFPQSSAAEAVRTTLAHMKQQAAIVREQWEKDRPSHPEDNYTEGQPLKDLAVPVEWAEPNEVGLRLGLAGVNKDSQWPFSSQHEVALYLRNDSEKPVRFAWSPRFDDGVDMSLTHADGREIRASITMISTPIFHNRARLLPGQFIVLKPAVSFLVSDRNSDDDDDRSAFPSRFSLEEAGAYRFDVRCHIGLRDWADGTGARQIRPRGEWEGTLACRPLSVTVTSAATAEPNAPAAEKADLSFGPARDDGLRAAWKLDPMNDAYQVGDIVKCAVVFHNAGKAPVTFQTDAWHQFDKWNATRADGSKIDVRTTWFTGLTPLETVTLQPGETREIPAHGVGIGRAEFAERYGRAELGAELWAEPGDKVTCVWDVQVSPSAVETLKTGPVSFAVAAAPPAGPRPPIVTDRLGSFDIAKGAILHLSQIGSADGYTNYAWITWEKARGAEADGKADIAMPRSKDPKDFSLPTFVISRTVPALWILEPAGLRKIDFGKTGEAKETKWSWTEAPADFGGAPDDAQQAIREHGAKFLSGQNATEGVRAFLAAQRVLDGEPTPDVARAWKAQETQPHQDGLKTAAIHLFPKGEHVFLRRPEGAKADPMLGSWQYGRVKMLPKWLEEFGYAKTDVIALRADDNAAFSDLKEIIPTLDEAGWTNIALMTGEPGPKRSCAARMRQLETELGLPFTGPVPKTTATVEVAADGSYTFDGTRETLEQAATRLTHIGATDTTIEIIVKADAQAPYAAVAALVDKAKEAGLTKVTVKTPETAAPTTEADLIRSATEVALAFFQAQTPAERVALLHLDDAARAAAAAFLESHPLAPEPKATVADLNGRPAAELIRQPDGSAKVKLMIDLPEAATKHLVLVAFVDGKPRLEWESSTVFQEAQYAELTTAPAGETRHIRASVKADDYFNRAFSDSERLVCYKLSHPGVARTLFGYAEKDSALAARLAAAAGQVSLTVTVPEGDRDANQVRIVDATTADTLPERSSLELRLVAEVAGDDTEALPMNATAGQATGTVNVEKAAVVSAEDVEETSVDGAQTGEPHWTVRVRLTEAAGRRLSDFTASHRGRQLAIVADGKVISAPKIMDTIGRDVAISGNFDEAAAKRLAEAIKPTHKRADPKAEKAPENALRLDVIDGTTKAPLTHFRVIAGVPSSVSAEFEKAKGVDVVCWQPHTIREGADGSLSWPLEKAYDKMALRVEAEGFVPQVVPWIEKKNGGRAISLELVKDEGIRGSVMTPEAKRPAHDATVVLAMIGRNARLKGSTFPELQLKPEPKSLRDAWERPLTVTPDEKGEFTLPTEVDPTAVVLILHGDGVLEMPYAEWKAQPNVTLQRWGRIHGRVRFGDPAGAGKKVSLIANHGDEHGYPDIVSQYDDTKSLDEGIFVFQRVLPGLCQLSCPIQAEKGNSSGITEINLTGMVTHATVTPSPPITPVVIGGVGRTVRGKLTGRPSWDGVTFHLHPTAPHIGLPGDEEMWKAWSAWGQSPQGAQFFRSGLKVAADGTFEIPGVLPGAYQIFFSAPGGKERVASSQFIVPAEQRDEAPEPLTLPDITP